MGRKGGLKNEQKANQDRRDLAKQQWTDAKQEREELRKLPVGQRPPNYLEAISKAEGILKRALAKSKKSETHSRKGKGTK